MWFRKGGSLFYFVQVFFLINESNQIWTCRFGIFPSWGLSQKLSRIIGPNKAREVSLTATPLTAEVAEKLGFVNHVVEEGQLLNKAREIAEAIIRNNQDMVVRYKSIINDGLKLDLGHALALEKVRTCSTCVWHYIAFFFMFDLSIT